MLRSMELKSLHNSITELGNTLKSAVFCCQHIRNPSETLRKTLLNYRLACPSVDEVSRVAKNSHKLRTATVEDYDLVRAPLDTARRALCCIRHKVDGYAKASIQRPSRRASQRSRITHEISSSFSRIASAIDSVILLISL